MWTISGFADEIADDFTTQCEVASGLGLKFLEVRSAWGVNILKLDDAQLDTMKQTLASYGLLVSSIGSPIGKIFIDEPFEPHLERMRHAGKIAQFFDAPYVRIFSFFIRPGSNPDDHRDEVLRRMRMHVTAGGRAAIGFGAGRGYDFDDFLADAAAAEQLGDVQHGDVVFAGPGGGRSGQGRIQCVSCEDGAVTRSIAVDTGRARRTILRGSPVSPSTPCRTLEAKSNLLIASVEQFGAVLKRHRGLGVTSEAMQRLPQRVERVSSLILLADEV